MTNTRNERGDITIDHERIVREYYEKFYANKLSTFKYISQITQIIKTDSRNRTSEELINFLN